MSDAAKRHDTKERYSGLFWRAVLVMYLDKRWFSGAAFCYKLLNFIYKAVALCSTTGFCIRLKANLLWDHRYFDCPKQDVESHFYRFLMKSNFEDGQKESTCSFTLLFSWWDRKEKAVPLMDQKIVLWIKHHPKNTASMFDRYKFKIRCR